MQIIRSFTTDLHSLLRCAAIAVPLSLLFFWRPLLGGLAVGLVVLVHLARFSGSSAVDGLGAGPALAASSWDDDLFTEPRPSSTPIETIETVDLLRPNDLHVFGDGLLSGGGWDDDFSNCGAGSNYPSFD